MGVKPFLEDRRPEMRGYGYTISSGLELDGDSAPELVVGAPFAGSRLDSRIGAVQVFAGRDRRLLHTWSGTQPGDLFGYAVSARRIDREGAPSSTLAIGAPGIGLFEIIRDEASSPSGGYVRIVHSSSLQAGIDVGGRPGQCLGSSVLVLDDVDGDGFCDVAAAALCRPGGMSAAAPDVIPAEVWVLSGQDGECVEVLHLGPEVLPSVALFGLPDLDGDGVDEVAISTLRTSASGRPVVEVVACSPPSMAELWSVQHPVPAGSSEMSCARLGDLDGDGRPDFAVAPDGVSAGPRPGVVALLLSSASGACLNRLSFAAAGNPFGTLGVALVGVPDGDGDGRADLGLAYTREGDVERSTAFAVLSTGEGRTLCDVLLLEGTARSAPGSALFWPQASRLREPFFGAEGAVLVGTPLDSGGGVVNLVDWSLR